jgi:phospholipid/cholesterol/gamma-HCH transport system permease protein
MLTKLGQVLLNTAQNLGEMLALLIETLFYFKEAPRNRSAIVAQLYEVGIGTLPIAALMSLFIGMVLALQTGSQLALLGVQEKIGAIVGMSMAKELGPVLTSLLIAGRVGSSMAAEVGAMQVYEEIDAMRTLEINPVRYLAMPRFIACLLAVPMLSVFSFIIGVTGGAVISEINPAINVPMTVYYDVLTRALDMQEILNGLIKATVFGGIVAQVGCYVGFKTTGGARGIGVSTTRSVVMSFLMIFVADYFLTRLMM